MSKALSWRNVNHILKTSNGQRRLELKHAQYKYFPWQFAHGWLVLLAESTRSGELCFIASALPLSKPTM